MKNMNLALRFPAASLAGVFKDFEGIHAPAY